MRALNKVAAAVSILLASAMAEQSFIDSVDFKGRGLQTGEILYHADDPDTPREAKYPEYTATFAYGPETYSIDSRSPDWELTDLSLIGLLVGFGCTGVFLIFAIVNIIVDEAERHEKFKAKVTEAKKTLTEDYDVTEKEMDEIDAEFEEKEKKGDKKDDKAEREELAEIN